MIINDSMNSQWRHKFWTSSTSFISSIAQYCVLTNYRETLKYEMVKFVPQPHQLPYVLLFMIHM